MGRERLRIGGDTIPVLRYRAIVVGSGAAGYAAANDLYDGGVRELAIITEGRCCGTSRNTGSDKQTYYKLTLCGGTPDSIREMAQTLFAGQCVDGDVALAEAASSVRCFLRLAELGLPFPVNRYGEYVGYKTDHDPKQRATSIGPLTSRAMTECLEREAIRKGIPLLDRQRVIELLVQNGRCCGVLLCAVGRAEAPFTAVFAENVVYATGGPAGIYRDSVYPPSQSGGSGVLFRAGVPGRNLTEWQYGLASLRPRWNVSGTYMQALPRLISTAQDGGDRREFLREYYPDAGAALDAVFLKGYEWPFDVRKLPDGSSLVDLAVYRETVHKKRRVFLDYRGNPFGNCLDLDRLGPAAYDYLSKAGALFGTPYERLRHMNQPAVEFYRSKGVDLAREPLEIALCAQHNNGGIAVDCWWRTPLTGLFVIGEAAGTHGVYRPGGSALNAGQVGACRAARYICAGPPPDTEDGGEDADWSCLLPTLALPGRILGTESNVRQLTRAAQRRMSEAAAAIRTGEGIRRCLRETEELLEHFSERVRIARPEELAAAYRLLDILETQRAYLHAFSDYLDRGGGSRGSALYLERASDLERLFQGAYPPGAGMRFPQGQLQEIWRESGAWRSVWRTPHPIPEESGAFETVWRDFRENGGVY